MIITLGQYHIPSNTFFNYNRLIKSFGAHSFPQLLFPSIPWLPPFLSLCISLYYNSYRELSLAIYKYASQLNRGCEEAAIDIGPIVYL